VTTVLGHKEDAKDGEAHTILRVEGRGRVYVRNKRPDNSGVGGKICDVAPVREKNKLFLI
jgi:hypothetical protein